VLQTTLLIKAAAYTQNLCHTLAEQLEYSKVPQAAGI